MGKCTVCGKETNSIRKLDNIGRDFEFICIECCVEQKRQEKRNVIEENLKAINKASDFKEWKKEDLSEAFWIHLGKYQKTPNRRSLDIVYKAYLWSVHDDHGLANSFSNALKWCKINLNAEMRRKDLPKKWEEEK